jgi:cullin 1
MFTESLGTCTVEMKVGKKPYDLSVTTLQAAVLDMFTANEDGSAPSYTLEEIVASLKLEEIFAKKVLHSLSCGKYKVLKKDPKSKKIQTGDTFTASTKFSNNSRKLRIPMANLQPSMDNATNRINTMMDNATYRIMKKSMQMTHENLVNEVLNKLGRNESVKRVKRSIERLIDRDYLERDENQSDLYRFRA